MGSFAVISGSQRSPTKYVIRRMCRTLREARTALEPGGLVVPTQEGASEGDWVDRYYAADTQAIKWIVYRTYRSMAGRTEGQEYRVSYQLINGKWLNGTRHKSRGDLMTDVRICGKPWASAHHEVRRKQAELEAGE